MKVIVNRCFGGFSLSESAYAALGLTNAYDEIERTDARLVALVEKDATAASGRFASLTVVDIPDDATDWTINDYDGMESIIYVQNEKLHYL